MKFEKLKFNEELGRTNEISQFVMNNEEISQFVKSLKDFMKHAEVEESNFHQRSEYEQYRKVSKVIIENEIEKLADFYEVTCDYIIQEFIL